MAQLEDSVGSRQKWYQRVETEVQRRVASVKEEMSVVRSEMAKTRAAADAAESKLKAATEMASADSRAAQEEHAAIIEQLEKERDEAREGELLFASLSRSVLINSLNQLFNKLGSTVRAAPLPVSTLPPPRRSAPTRPTRPIRLPRHRRTSRPS